MIRPKSIYFGESTQLMNSLYLWQCLNACILSIHMDVMDDGYDACIDHAFFLRANRRDLVKLETMGMYCWWVGKSELMAMVSALIF